MTLLAPAETPRAYAEIDIGAVTVTTLYPNEKPLFASVPWPSDSLRPLGPPLARRKNSPSFSERPPAYRAVAAQFPATRHGSGSSSASGFRHALL
jgi:hypothetical protein